MQRDTSEAFFLLTPNIREFLSALPIKKTAVLLDLRGQTWMQPLLHRRAEVTMLCPKVDRMQHSTQSSTDPWLASLPFLPSYGVKVPPRDFWSLKFQFKESKITSRFYTYRMNEKGK